MDAITKELNGDAGFIRRGEGPDPVDIHVGSRVRLRRIAMGLSQQELGDRVGVTFQQLQKYEKGANRISCSMLDRLTDALGVPHSFFFDGRDGKGELADLHDDGIKWTRWVIELVRNLMVVSPAQRERVLLLVKAMAGDDGGGATVSEDGKPKPYTAEEIVKLTATRTNFGSGMVLVDPQRFEATIEAARKDAADRALGDVQRWIARVRGDRM